MPGSTVLEDIRISRPGRGGTIPPPADGGEGDRGGGGDASVPRRAYFTGLTLGLAAILMFFMALTSAFIVRKGLGGDWQALHPPQILWLNTALLLASSATIEIARRKHAAQDSGTFRGWWGITTLLGLAFLAGQILAWRQLAAAGMFLAANPSASFFYVFTGAHGVHLLGGVVALLYVAFRAWTHSRITQGTAVDLVAVYWHFMDGLWVFLFLLISLGR